MKPHALELKQKSIEGVSKGILRNFITATSENKTEEEKGAQRPLWFQVFTISRVVIFLSYEAIFLLHKFSHSGAF